MAEDNGPHGEPLEKLSDMLESQCGTCGRKRPNGPTCDAYPFGIPLDIALNRVRHDRPVKGDLGLQWEPREAGDVREDRPLG